MSEPGMVDSDVLGPPPYEIRLSERPADREQFNDFVRWTMYACRPSRRYGAPFWASPTRRRQAKQHWQRMIRAYAGRIYELGRMP